MNWTSQWVELFNLNAFQTSFVNQVNKYILKILLELMICLWAAPHSFCQELQLGRILESLVLDIEVREKWKLIVSIFNACYWSYAFFNFIIFN